MLFPFLSGSTRNESLSYDRLVRFGSIEACVSKVRSFACQRPPSNAGTTRLNYRWNRNDPGALSLHGKYGVSGISPLRRNRKLILIIQSCTYRRSVRLNLSIGISFAVDCSWYCLDGGTLRLSYPWDSIGDAQHYLPQQFLWKLFNWRLCPSSESKSQQGHQRR